MNTRYSLEIFRGEMVQWIGNEWCATNPQIAHCSKLVADKLSMHRRRIGKISSWKLDTAKTSLSGRIGSDNPEGSSDLIANL